MSDLTARHLIQQGAKTLLVANRTESRAEKIADALRTPAITTGVIPFEQMQDQAHRADVVITSTGAGQIFTTDQARAILQRRRNRPVFFIDIAVPRDVAPAVNAVEGCFVYDMDDLQQVAAQHHASRGKEAEAAESIVSREVERYSAAVAPDSAAAAIRSIMREAEAVRATEFARAAQRLASEPLTEAQSEVVEAMTRSLATKLLLPQVDALRTAGSAKPDESG